MVCHVLRVSCLQRLNVKAKYAVLAWRITFLRYNYRFLDLFLGMNIVVD